MITDIIIVLVLALILGGALWYMKKEKDKGTTCIGCPDAGTCAKRQAGEGELMEESVDSFMCIYEKMEKLDASMSKEMK